MKVSRKPMLLYKLQKKWERRMDLILSHSILEKVKNISVYMALAGFVLTLISVALKKLGFIQSHLVPDSYFAAIYVAFSFVLFYEVLSMVYAIPASIASSIRHQYQVMSLILIRHVFEMIGHRHNINDIFEETHAILEIGTGVGGALFIFFLIAFYKGLQKHRAIVENEEDLYLFIFIKKVISIGTILIFLTMGIQEFLHFLYQVSGKEAAHASFGHHFYGNFFTLMVFIDILLVLLAMNFGETYHVVFRNTGLMISTVILRISFSESIYTWVVLTITAVIVGVVTTLIYNYHLKIEDSLRKIKTMKSSSAIKETALPATGKKSRKSSK